MEMVLFAMQVSNYNPATLIMEANLSFGKKSSRVPLTKGCCRLASPRVRPSAGTAPFCCSSRQTWICARPLYSVVQLLICSRSFQSKNSNVKGWGKGGVEGASEQGERGRKKNGGTERKCRWDNCSSFLLRSEEVVSSEQARSLQWRSSKWGLANDDMLFSIWKWVLDELRGRKKNKTKQNMRDTCLLKKTDSLWEFCWKSYFI